MSSASILTIILNWRTAEMTLQSAEAALREMDGMDGRIVIVDNNSGDGSFETINAEIRRRSWPRDRVDVVQSGRNGGFGAGNNFGILHALAHNSYDYIYILNSDAFPDPGSIEKLRAHLVANPKTGIAGSYIHGPDGTPHVTAFRFPSIRGELEGAARVGPISRLFKNHIVPLLIPAVTTQVDWLAGASMLLRRQMLEQIGLFDEAYFLYFEETDLCLRAAKVGWRTDFVRASEVTHIGSVSTGMRTWARMPQYWFDSRFYYFRRNHGLIYAVAATLAHLCGAALWRLRRLIGNKPRRDPKWFLFDLIRHDFAGLFKPLPPSRTELPDISPASDMIREPATARKDMP